MNVKQLVGTILDTVIKIVIIAVVVTYTYRYAVQVYEFDIVFPQITYVFCGERQIYQYIRNGGCHCDGYRGSAAGKRDD